MKENLFFDRKMALLVAVACAVAFAPSHAAKADRLPLPPSVAIGIGDQHELGTVVHGVPEGDQDITQYVNAMILLAPGGSSHVLSGWALFTAGGVGVPDGGATVMLLGAALALLGITRRLLARRT